VVVWPGDDLADVLDPLAGLALGQVRHARRSLVEGEYVVRPVPCSARTSTSCAGTSPGGRGGCGRRGDVIEPGTGARRLGWFNDLPDDQAVRELLAVCHSRRWAERVAAGRPYPDLATLQGTADEVWTALEPGDWLEALAGHPRIGERGGASPGSSSREQAGAAAAGQDVRGAIAGGNAEYERRFGHVFLISAEGRGAEEILANLRERLGNDPTPSCGSPPASTGASTACGWRGCCGG
jgi:2-oxo-4-hydroxy-4-carboxy-5-ureidoimidazoline decarboxylase